jgi:hypothetical protein
VKAFGVWQGDVFLFATDTKALIIYKKGSVHVYEDYFQEVPANDVFVVNQQGEIFYVFDEKVIRNTNSLLSDTLLSGDQSLLPTVGRMEEIARKLGLKGKLKK